MKPLRLTEKEMMDFDAFNNTFVRQCTDFFPPRGKVMVWAIASLYFFAQLKLQGRNPFEINLEKLAEIFDLTCAQKMSDFKIVMNHLKQAHNKLMKAENAETDEMIYKACKELQAHENTMIREGSAYIAK
jgi:predicted PilT family ATPase